MTHPDPTPEPVEPVDDTEAVTSDQDGAPEDVDPDEDRRVEQAGRESFPASDAPSFNPGTA